MLAEKGINEAKENSYWVVNLPLCLRCVKVSTSPFQGEDTSSSLVGDAILGGYSKFQVIK